MDNAGDRGRLMENIYREIRPELLAYFQRRHGSPQTAEDLLQETFAAVMKNPDRLLRADSPRAYLFGVARNLSAEFYRRFHPAEELPAQAPTDDEESADPRLEAMREAILRLNADSRQVLELRLYRELPYEEMAATLGVPIGTVRSRLHHAVRQLREQMKNSDYE
ncbi:MAG: sigma-70 family RNA polymerase sigma factor [Verrucomicrobiota bacterium]|jgi:RNA polymerase sigma-70 factor (ECF subfamily)